LVALGLTVLASTATAQYRAPVPPPVEAVPVPPPNEPTPVDEKKAPADETKAPPRDARPVGAALGLPSGGWDKEFVIDALLEKNVGFVSPPGPNDASGSLRATLVRWQRSARTNLRLTLDGAGFAHVELHDRDRIDVEGLLQLDSRLSTRTSGSLSARFAHGHTDTESMLVAQGVVLPPARMDSGQVGGILTRQLGERTAASVDAGWDSARFDSPFLLDMTTWTGGATVKRILSTRDSLSALARIQRFDDGVTIRQIPALSLQLAHSIGAKLKLDLGAGYNEELSTRVTDGAALPSRRGFMGSVGLAGQIRRATIVARYSHELRPPIGLGVTVLTDVFTLDATVPIGRYFALLASGGFSMNREPAAGTGYDNTDMYMGASYFLGRNTQLVLGYRLRKRGTFPAGESARNDRASVSLVWSPGRPASGSGTPTRRVH
jgi:hypothetical protein